MLYLYNLLLLSAIIFGFPLILLTVFASRKRRKTIFPRLGLMSLPSQIHVKTGIAPDHRPIWIHALSVGETHSAASLIDGIRDHFRHYPIFFSVSTQTGFEVAHELLKEKADRIFYFPYDLPFLSKHAASRIHPLMVIIVESDVWPNFLNEIKKRNIPLVLTNARLSDRSFRRYRKVPSIARFMYAFFSAICTQSEKDAQRFLRLGISENKIYTTGNVKFDRSNTPISNPETAKMKHSMNIRSGKAVFLAGSTHPGEESILFDSLLRLKKSFPDLVMLIVPRDPTRGEKICLLARNAGLRPALRSALNGQDTPDQWDTLIVDTIGELAHLYGIADIAFVGGSLVQAGGHNPLEPAAYGIPVLFGPDMTDFKVISDMLIDGGGAIRIKTAKALCHVVEMLLKNPAQAKAMGANAFQILTSHRGAVQKNVMVLKQFVFNSTHETYP